jgi:hypothetical protein
MEDDSGKQKKNQEWVEKERPREEGGTRREKKTVYSFYFLPHRTSRSLIPSLAE